MKILIDDVRLFLPDGSTPDIVVRNYDAGLHLIYALGADSNAEWPEHDLFIDHDLGGQRTGYDLMCVFESIIFNDPDKAQDYTPKSITCVSDNPVDRRRIQQVIDKIYKES